MAPVTATLCSTLLFVFVFVSGEQKNITAVHGQNVTLTCRAPNSNIIVVQWIRADLKPEYVLVYRDGHIHPDEQHPSFRNRVDLQDRQMKDGDVSVILKNVTTADDGTYECCVAQRVSEPLRLLSTMYLIVVPPPGPSGGLTVDGGKEDGSIGLIVSLSVSALLLVAAAVGFVIYRNHKQIQDPYLPHDEPQPV